MPNLATTRLVATATMLPCCAFLLLAAPSQTQARPSPLPPNLDLRVQPGDVQPDTDDLPIGVQGVNDVGGPFATPEAMAEADRMQRTEIPNRRRGPGAVQPGEGNFLQDLLQNKTIPLFRVTVEPPF